MRNVARPALRLGMLAAGLACGGRPAGQRGNPALEPAGETGPGNVTISAPADDPCAITIDFGDVPIGQVETAELQIVNQGTSELALSLLNPSLDPELTVSFQNHGPMLPGDYTAFTASFWPYETGRVTSSFTIATDGANRLCSSTGGNTDLNVTLQGNGIQLSLSVDPNPLDFGNTLVNTSMTRSVTLTNTSSTSISGVAAALGGSDQSVFQLGEVPDSLAAGASATIDITYAPIALETRSFANVVFAISTGTNGRTQNEVTLALFGEPVGAALVVSPNPIDFGFVQLGATEIACTEVTNQSNVTVFIESIGSFNTASNAYAVSGTDDATPPNPLSYPLAIDSGSSAKVCFAFTPRSEGQYRGSAILVTQGDPSGDNLAVDLVGWGGGPTISCTPPSLDFGDLQVGQIATAAVLCTNVGTAVSLANLLLQPPSVSPDAFTAHFDQSLDPYPVDGLAPGKSAQIDVSYSPTAAGDDDGALLVFSNGNGGQPVTIALSGRGLVP